MRTGRNERRTSRRTDGYIIEQLLISLAVCAFLIPICSAILSILLRALEQPLLSQDETGIAQLRHVINVSDNFECSGSELRFTHHGDDQILHLTNGNLILTHPGTQIFLTDLSSVSFELEGELIFLNYEHPEKEPSRRCLGHI